MKKQQHTPGPWRHYDDRQKTGRHEVLAIGRTVARIYYFDDQAVADAHLIAAAPDMYEIICAVDDAWTEDFPGGPDQPIDKHGLIALDDDTLAVWKKIRAARARIEVSP